MLVFFWQATVRQVRNNSQLSLDIITLLNSHQRTGSELIMNSNTEWVPA